MEKNIKIADRIDAEVNVPGSKSIANRALIAAALADGDSVLDNFPSSDDCMLMLEALKRFGVVIDKFGDRVAIKGTSGKISAPDGEIYTDNAGTVMRFLTSFATLAEGTTRLVGNERMNKRPIQGLALALKQLGAEIETCSGYPPVTVRGPKLVGGTANIDSTVSSQFISSILLSAPYAESDVRLTFKNSIPSQDYIKLTIDLMREFGVIVNQSTDSYQVFRNKYIPSEFKIEGDYSSASYFFAAALITKGKILIRNINSYSKQPDSIFLNILKNMGCEILFQEESVFLDAGKSKIKSFSIDANFFPDLVPALAIVALFADGKSRIFNVAHLRYKETDRLKALATELGKLGAMVNEVHDGIEIYPANVYNGAVIETYNDHRMAMSFAIAGLKIEGVKIKNPECVKKSFPDFWNEFEKLQKV